MKYKEWYDEGTVPVPPTPLRLWDNDALPVRELLHLGGRRSGGGGGTCQSPRERD
jgi:hypothetical protein